MLHIFDHRNEEPEPPAGKKPTLSRLQTVLSAAERTAVSPEPPKEASEQAAPPGWRRGGGPAPAAASPVAAMATSAPAAPVRSAEFEKFAQEFTKSFLAAVSRAVEDIHGLVVQDRGTVELLARDHRELSGRVARLEERVAQQGNNNAVEAALQEIQRRLDLQAGAIRAIHAANQARDEKLERLISAFQGLHALTGAAPGPAAVNIPDSL